MKSIDRPMSISQYKGGALKEVSSAKNSVDECAIPESTNEYLVKAKPGPYLSSARRASQGERPNRRLPGPIRHSPSQRRRGGPPPSLAARPGPMAWPAPMRGGGGGDFE